LSTDDLRLEVHHRDRFVSLLIIASPHVVHQFECFFTEAPAEHGFTFNPRSCPVVSGEKLNWLDTTAIESSDVCPLFRLVVSLSTLLNELDRASALTHFTLSDVIGLAFTALHILDLVRDEEDDVGRHLVAVATFGLEMPLSRSGQGKVLDVLKSSFNLESEFDHL